MIDKVIYKVISAPSSNNDFFIVEKFLNEAAYLNFKVIHTEVIRSDQGTLTFIFVMELKKT